MDKQQEEEEEKHIILVYIDYKELDYISTINDESRLVEGVCCFQTIR